jgi:hypothetical protein
MENLMMPKPKTKIAGYLDLAEDLRSLRCLVGIANSRKMEPVKAYRLIFKTLMDSGFDPTGYLAGDGFVIKVWDIFAISHPGGQNARITLELL